MMALPFLKSIDVITALEISKFFKIMFGSQKILKERKKNAKENIFSYLIVQ